MTKPERFSCMQSTFPIHIIEAVVCIGWHAEFLSKDLNPTCGLAHCVCDMLILLGAHRFISY